jgi:hypothetical protein
MSGNMTAEELSRSAAADPASPAGTSPAAQVLWYMRAGKPIPPKSMSLDQEWLAIATELVG